MEQRLSVITLGVQDLEKSRTFYEKGLGWKVSPSSNEHIILFQIGGMVLSLFSKRELEKDVGLKIEPGFSGITLAYIARNEEEVRDVLNKAEKAGGEIVKSAQKVFWGGYSGYFTDPDGYPFEVAWNPYWPLDDKGNVNVS
ncbi:VOC family protein [Candidatus Paracaedibacter symbiosus]|uniref:VOC family protein n=1 Tax=Candidatus Paracaedibacter symbiosus TaxID=244582 RepID=UPI000509812B|nr:VOC family protein [Candidatus Paracaedibacter symbiosus]